MAVDPRQVVAGFLTISMFAMLGNMIKRDHFDSIEVINACVPLFPMMFSCRIGKILCKGVVFRVMQIGYRRHAGALKLGIFITVTQTCYSITG